MGEHQVQRGVVLHQRVVLIVPDELHHRSEREGVGEAVLPIAVVDLYQLVVPVLPEKSKESRRKIKIVNVKKKKKTGRPPAPVCRHRVPLRLTSTSA